MRSLKHGMVASILVCLLTACGAGATKTPTGTAVSLDNKTKKIEKSTELGDMTVPASIPNAAELKGPTLVPTIGPIEPISTEVTSKIPAEVIDNKKTKVTIKDVSRIVPLDIYGSTSKTIIALGIGKNIVGRTVSDTDPGIAKVPVVTRNGHDLNIEALLALRPTLVFIDTTVGKPTLVNTLRDAGITVVVLNPDRRADIIKPQVMMVADALGLHENGVKVMQRVDKQLAEVRTYVKALAAKTSTPLRTAMLYVRGTAGVFFIFGKGSAAEALIADLGAHDVAQEANLGEIVPANAEALSKINPQVILVMSGGMQSTGGLDGLLQRPGVAQTTAGQNKRVVAVADAQLLSFGVDYPLALKLLAEGVYLGKNPMK